MKSRRAPRLLAEAAGIVELPVTEMGKPEEEQLETDFLLLLSGEGWG